MSKVLPVDLAVSDPVVSLEEVVKRYPRTVALDGVDLSVPEGAVYALIGENGAGKTTTMRLLLDLTRPDAGRIEVFGCAVASEGPAIRSSIGYIPEGEGLGYDWMRVGRLLQHHSVYYPSWDASYADHLVATLGVDTSRRYGVLSKGQRRRVQLVLALAIRPQLLLLDEPTDGLDPVMRDRVCAILAEHLADSPATVIVSTHRVYELEGLIDHVGVLHKGRIVTQAATDTLRSGVRRYRVRIDGAVNTASIGLNGTVLGRRGEGRESDWTVWGDEPEVIAGLRSAGASVSDVEALTLDELALEILKMEA